MSDVTQILSAIEAGDPKAAAELLPLVYDELRKLAAARLAEEKPGQTLQATALVHEAYLRLVGGIQPRDWNGRGHFFAAAAEAMRRILIHQILIHQPGGTASRLGRHHLYRGDRLGWGCGWEVEPVPVGAHLLEPGAEVAKVPRPQVQRPGVRSDGVEPAAVG